MSYIIQDLVQQGYWSISYKSFKGILFATRLETLEHAERIAQTLINNGKSRTLTIIKIIE